MHMEDLSVLSLKTNLEQDVVCVTALMKRSLEHRHVRIMEESGINMSRIILIIPIMELEDSSRDLERIYLGSQLLKPICNHMMNLLLRQAENFIFLHLVSTVWKHYVLHVAQLLHGQSLQNQNHQPIFWIFLKQFIQLKNHVLHIFALTKLVWFSALPLWMGVGMQFGRKLPDL